MRREDGGKKDEVESGQNGRLYPIMLTPSFFVGRGVLVVGGGMVAERKVRGLLAAGAKVRVIAPTLTEELQQLVEAGRLEWTARGWQVGDVSSDSTALLVFVATNDPVINQVVSQEARAAGRLVNRADDATASDFTLPATIYTEEITLTVATANYSSTGKGEASPALTTHLKKRLEQFIGPEYSALARLLRELRPQVKAQILYEQRPALWQQLINSPTLDLLRQGKEAEARQLLEEIILNFEF